MDSSIFRQSVEQMGLSLSQFASLMEVTPKTVSLWANNHASVPRPVSLYIELRVSNLEMAEKLKSNQQ